MVLPYIKNFSKPFAKSLKNFNIGPVNNITNKPNIFGKREKDKIKKQDQHNFVKTMSTRPKKVQCNIKT